MASVLTRLPEFEARHPGALQAYLRQAVLNQIRDHIRRTHRRPEMTSVHGDEPGRTASPLEEAIGSDVLDRYEAALSRLRDEERLAVHLRLELEYDYDEVAEALEKPTANAARMAVARALIRLAEEMDHDA